MAWEENKHPRDEDGKFTSKGNEGNNDKTQLIEQVVNKMTNGGTKEVNLNAGTIARASNGQLTEEEVHKWFEDNDELEDYEAFDDDNDFENWEDNSIVSDAQEELGVNALDSYENYEKVCDWLIDNGYADDYGVADKMIKDSLSPEGWDKLNQIREDWGIEDLEETEDEVDDNQLTPKQWLDNMKSQSMEGMPENLKKSLNAWIQNEYEKMEKEESRNKK